MRVLRFEIVNEKAIASWIHDANGKHVEIAGETGSGKTTAASCLWDVMTKSKDCLKHGTKKGYITLHLGDVKPELVATRNFTAKTNTVNIERADGSRISASDFKAMISSLSENPHRIKDMKPKERVATLLKAADLGDVSMEAIDEHIVLAEEARLTAYRKMEATQPGDEPAEVEPIDASAIGEELRKAAIANDAIDEDQREINEIIRFGKEQAGAAGKLRIEIEELEGQLEGAKQELSIKVQSREDVGRDYTARKAAHDAMQRIETGELSAKLATATQTNDKAAEHVAWAKRDVAHDEAKDAWEQTDSDVKARQVEKKSLLENAKWPLPGLSIEDGDVIYNGSLFDNLGESEQMLVCAALAVKDILAHPLRVCRMDGCESMSKEDFAKLQELFGSNDIQVISTRVSRGSIDDGELVITEREEA